METVQREMPAEVVDYLRLHHVITLSTASFTGMPHADTVVYANDERLLYFIALDTTAMARNIKDNRYVSFTIDDYTTDWRKVRELQGVGRCKPADLDEEHVALTLAAEKFGSAFTRPPGVLYRIAPSEMHFVDYDYPTVVAQTAPQVSSRIFTIEGAPPVPSRGAVSTELDKLRFDAGEVIFRPGGHGGRYFVVVEGEVEVRAEGHGADQTVVRVGPGELFGDEGSLRGQQGVMTAYAVTPTVLLAVQREAMRDLLMPEEGDH